MNKNGSSRRANTLVNRWNRVDGYNKYAARVVKKNVAGRKKILNWEAGRSTAILKAGGTMKKHSRPRIYR